MQNNYFNDLTKREKEVVKLALKGFTNAEIAKQLNISAHTVKAYIESIYRKFNVHNRVQMTVYAIKTELICQTDLVNDKSDLYHYNQF